MTQPSRRTEGTRFPRAFVLHRHEDVTGVSGTGIVAEGVEFSDGTVSLRWTSASPTSVVFHDNGIESVKKVHGHSGATRIVFLDNQRARREADLLDEAQTLRDELKEVRLDRARVTAERDAMVVRLRDGAVSDEEIVAIGDRAWGAAESSERAS